MPRSSTPLKIKGVNAFGMHVSALLATGQAGADVKLAISRRPEGRRLSIRIASVALSEIDRSLLQRCLARKPRAWEDFVDRFMGLVVHVVNHSAQSRSLRLTPEDREDLVAQVFLTIVKDDLAVLRHFRGESSLATYLTVIARRVVVAELLRQRAHRGTTATHQTPEHEYGDGRRRGRTAASATATQSNG